MNLSIATDYAASTGNPGPCLKRIAEAGFSHIHWCHQWNTDFVYSSPEISAIKNWLTEYGLQLLDLHGSMGREKNWGSTTDYEREAGVQLVQNRLEMTAHLGGKAVIMHLPFPDNLDPVRRSLDDLMPVSKGCSVSIALENGNATAIETLLREYEPSFLGFCFDSGHAFVDKEHQTLLKRFKARTLAVHLHDNDGATDQHKIPYTGGMDWEVLLNDLRATSYKGCINLEVGIMNSGITDEELFLASAREAGNKLSGQYLEVTPPQPAPLHPLF